MTALSHNPSTTNFLAPNRFKLMLKRAPNIEFFAQKVNIPGMAIPTTTSPNPMIQQFLPGDHIEYETFDMTFIVDEKLANYFELYNWLKGIGFPDDFEQYAALSSNPEWTGIGVKSTLVLTILNSAQNAIFEVTLTDAYPTSLSDLQFDTTQPDVNYVQCAASFRFTSLDIVPVISDGN